MAVQKINSRKNNFVGSCKPSRKNQQIIHGNLSFSFQYFEKFQNAGQSFEDWQKDGILADLMNTIKEFCGNTKLYWLNQRVGAGGLKKLAIYGDFPINSDFEKPKYIPQNVLWARFRLDSSARLIGFFYSDEDAIENNLSSEIFYVVFLDKNHRFYKMEKEK